MSESGYSGTTAGGSASVEFVLLTKWPAVLGMLVIAGIRLPIAQVATAVAGVFRRREPPRPPPAEEQ